VIDDSIDQRQLSEKKRIETVRYKIEELQANREKYRHNEKNASNESWRLFWQDEIQKIEFELANIKIS
jgi:hypothetical protein